MRVDLNNKTVILAGSGIENGMEMALAFAENGAKVVVAGTTEQKIDEIKEKVIASGGKAIAVKTDITDRFSCAAMVEEAVKNFGTVDFLVNYTRDGMTDEQRKTIQNYDDDLWKKITREDLDGVYYCSKEAILLMKKQGNGGSIVNITTAAGMIVKPMQTAYSATKGALINMSKAMALELAPLGIRVNVVAPGALEGVGDLPEAGSAEEMSMFSHIPLGRMGKPADIVELCCFLCGEGASYITGAVIPADGGWTDTYTRDF